MATIPNKGGVIPYSFTPIPSDTVAIKSDANNTKVFEAVAIYVLVTGNITAVVAGSNQVVTFTGVTAHTVIGGPTPILFSRINATGLTATVLAVAPLF